MSDQRQDGHRRDESGPKDYTVGTRTPGGSSWDYGRGDEHRGPRGGGDQGGRGARRGDYVVRDLENLTIVDKSELIRNFQEIPSKLDSKFKINCFEVDVSYAKDVYQYDLRFVGIKTGHDGKEKKIELWVQDRNDIAKNNKYLTFFELFKILQRENQSFFRIYGDSDDRNPLYVYDRSRTLYSTERLLEDEEEQLFDLNPEDLVEDRRRYIKGFKKIEAILKRTGFLGNLKNVNSEDQTAVRPVLSYLDILLFQQAYSRNLYYVFGHKLYLREKEKNKKWNQAERFDLKPGMTKGCNIFEIFDEKNEKNLNEKNEKKEKIFLQIDPKFAVFYKEEKLKDFIKREFKNPERENYRNFTKVLKGVVVETTHLRKKQLMFVINGFSSDGSDRIYFNYDGNDISVADFFERIHNVRIDMKSWPCVIQKQGSKKNFYPIDVLKIVSGQRVPKEKMDSQVSNSVIRACEQKPSDLDQNLSDILSDAGITNSNPDFRKAGIRISTKPTVTDGTELHMPAVQYRDKKVDITSGNWKIENFKFYRGSQICRILTIYDSVPEEEVRNFMKKLIRVGKNLGMAFKDLDYREIRSYDVDEIRGITTDSYDFVFMISNSKDKHQILKFREMEKKIPTQQIKPQTMKKSHDILVGILMKMNLKNRGINKVLTTHSDLISKLDTNFDLVKSMLQKTLLIGIEFSHPSPGGVFDRSRAVEDRSPTCVGIVSNSTDSGVDNGDYFYVKRKSTFIKSEIFKEKIKKCIQIYRQESGFYPTSIVVYRPGTSIGQVQDTVNTECRDFYDAVAEVVNAVEDFCVPKLVYSAVQKTTPNRVIPAEFDQKNPQNFQNVKPGTTVINAITNSMFREFVLVGHRSHLGTAKPITVTVLYPYKGPQGLTDAEFSLFVNLTNDLCYTCEAVNGPISVPGPLDSASKVAQRGLNNWKFKYRKNDDDSVSSDSRRPEQALTEEERKIQMEEDEARIQEKLIQWSEELQPEQKRSWWT